MWAFIGFVLISFYIFVKVASSFGSPFVAHKQIDIKGVIANLHVTKFSDYSLEISISGPDGRYNSAREIYSSAEIKDLIQSFKRASEKIEKNEKNRATASFEFPINKNISVFIGQHDGYVKFYQESSTRRFSRRYSAEETITIIETLISIPAVAKNVATDYNRLTGKGK